MSQALFLDPSALEPTADEGVPRLAPSSAGVLLVNPHLFAADRVRVQALLRSLARLKESDLAPLQKAVATLTADDDRAAWDAIDARLEADNLALRERFVFEGGGLTLSDLAQRWGSGIDQAQVMLEQWEFERQIISAKHGGDTYFPTFQFRDGRPHPTMKLALAALPADLTSWEKVFWFVSANGWVDNDAPGDRLDEPDLVVQAARYEGEPVVG